MIKRPNEASVGPVRVAAFAGATQDVVTPWVKKERQQNCNPAAQPQLWTRYIESRLRNFGTR
jgi:hypothetical protein